ncbi:MAG: histidine phosphatase family protein, partial [Microbacterium sp.]
FYHRPPGGESWADVALRLRSFLGDAANGPAETVMIVAHDAVVMLVIALLLPLEEEELLEFAASHTVLNASVTHLVRGEDGWRLVEFAAVEHLTSEGAPVTVHPGNPDVEPE